MIAEKVHKFNQVTLGIDKELEELFDKEINLFLTPLEVEENAVVGAIWDTAGDTRVCPLCESLSGQIFPVESGEFARIEPPIHVACRCMMRYVTGRQRGIEERLKEYRPINTELLKKWSSKIYTDAEIREMINREPKLLFKITGSKHEKDMIENLMKKLSPGVRESLDLDEIRFLDRLSQANWTGIYHPAVKRIEIARHLVDIDDTMGQIVVFHEVGHSLETNFTIAENRLLAKFYRQAKLNPNLAITEYSLYRQDEFWADNFAYFLIRPKMLMEKNKAMYSFIAGFLIRVTRGV